MNTSFSAEGKRTQRAGESIQILTVQESVILSPFCRLSVGGEGVLVRASRMSLQQTIWAEDKGNDESETNSTLKLDRSRGVAHIHIYTSCSFSSLFLSVDL